MNFNGTFFKWGLSFLVFVATAFFWSYSHAMSEESARRLDEQQAEAQKELQHLQKTFSKKVRDRLEASLQASLAEDTLISSCGDSGCVQVVSSGAPLADAAAMP